MYTLYHEYLLTGSIENVLDVMYKITEILDKLEEAFTQWYNPIVKDEFFLATARFLDTLSYVHLEFDELFESVNTIQNHYHEMLIANGCELNRLKSEFCIAYNHVIKFLKK